MQTIKKAVASSSLLLCGRESSLEEFILLLPQAAVLPGSDVGSDGVNPTSGFVIQNRQTSCSM